MRVADIKWNSSPSENAWAYKKGYETRGFTREEINCTAPGVTGGWEAIIFPTYEEAQAQLKKAV